MPIRYVYPSRTVTLRPLTLALGAVWALAFVALIWLLPAPPRLAGVGSLIYPVYYFALSLWLTARREPRSVGYSPVNRRTRLRPVTAWRRRPRAQRPTSNVTSLPPREWASPAR